MGQSASALLYYGVYLGEDAELPWDQEEFYGCLETWYFQVVLGRKDIVTFTEATANDPDATKRWYEERKELIAKCPIDFDHIGYDYSETVIVLRHHTAETDWERPKDVNLNSMLLALNSDHRQVDAAVELCEKYKICDFTKARWQLGAHYA